MAADGAARGWSLRDELARVLVVAALLPALAFGCALLWSQWQQDRSDLRLRLDSNAQLSAGAIDDFLQGQLSGAALLAEDFPADGERADASLRRLLRAYPAMSQAWVEDAGGRTRSAFPAEATVRLHAPQAIGAMPAISDAYAGSAPDAPVLVAVSAPLLQQGRVTGALHAAIPMQRTLRLRSGNLRRRGFEFLLLDRRGRVVHASEGLRWRPLDDAGAEGADLRRGAVRAGTPGGLRAVAGLLRDGGDGFASAVAMHSGWTVVVVAPAQRLLAPGMQRVALLLGLVAITGLGVVFALRRLRVVLAGSLGRVLSSLHGYALGGALDPAQLARMPQELQPLGAGIGGLARRMNEAYDQLRDVIAQREAMIDERTRALRQAVSDLDRLSRTDALTGSLNYRGVLEAGEGLWTRARETGAPLAVLALDIDHFKRYNDLYGHAEGDGALRRFAGAVSSALLHADDLLARPGGEEFIVFLPGSSAAQAMQVAQRVCDRVRAADIAHAGSPAGRLTVSIGVAAMEAADADLEALLRRADAALYRAKAAGRDRASA